jgi:hypothetical protein
MKLKTLTVLSLTVWITRLACNATSVVTHCTQMLLVDFLILTSECFCHTLDVWIKLQNLVHPSTSFPFTHTFSIPFLCTICEHWSEDTMLPIHLHSPDSKVLVWTEIIRNTNMAYHVKCWIIERLKNGKACGSGSASCIGKVNTHAVLY